MTNAQSLDSLKLKDLVAIAESLKLSNWRRLSKSELRELILQQPPYAGSAASENVANAGKTRKRAASKSKDAVKTKDETLLLFSEEQAASRRTAKTRKVAESAKPTVKRASRTTKEKRAEVLPPLEEKTVKTRSKSKGAAEPVKVETSREPEELAKSTGKAKANSGGRRSVKETVADAMRKAALTAESPNSPENSVKKTRMKKTKNAEIQTMPDEGATAVKKTRRKRADKEPEYPLLNAAPEEKPAEKKSSRSAKKTQTEPLPEPDADAAPKRGRKRAASQPDAQSAQSAEETSATRTKVRKNAKAQPDEKIADDATVVVNERETPESASAAPKRGGARKRAPKTEKGLVDTPSPEKSREEPPKPVAVPAGSKTEERPAPAKKPVRPARRPALSNETIDCLRLNVCNSYWLVAQWNISENNTSRVRSAMGRLWHTAEPILRVYRVDKEPQIASVRREHIADVPVRLPVRCWFVPVENPPRSFMLELGYNSREGEFFTLASSNIVDTPPRLMDDSPLDMSMVSHIGMFDGSSAQVSPFNGTSWGASNGFHNRSFGESDGFVSAFGETRTPFGRADKEDEVFQTPSSITISVDAEIVIKGRVSKGASVKIRDEQIPTKADGSFSVRLDLPERRHVFPVVATSYDDAETQTIILAVDRNTKTLDPIFKEDEE